MRRGTQKRECPFSKNKLAGKISKQTIASGFLLSLLRKNYMCYFTDFVIGLVIKSTIKGLYIFQNSA